MDEDTYSIYESVPKGWRGALVSLAIRNFKKNRNAWKGFMNIIGKDISFPIEREDNLPKKRKPITKTTIKEGKKQTAETEIEAEVEFESGWG